MTSDSSASAQEAEPGDGVLNIAGPDLRLRVREGLDIPEWFSYPNVVEELRRSYPPRDQQGITVFFTELPSSGQSTITNVLMSRLM